MTQPTKEPTHTVLRAGFANPLTLDMLVTDETFVKVYVDDVLLPDTEYSVSGVDDPNGIEITITDGEDPDFYPEALNISAVFDPPISQPDDLSAGGRFGLAYENAIDAIVRIILSIKGKLDRTLKVPYGIPGDIVLPSPVPGATFMWNEDGDGFVTGPTAVQVANAELYALRAEDAADRAEAAALAAPISTLLGFQSAIRGDNLIVLDTSLDEITLDDDDVDYWRVALPRIRADVPTEIYLPAGRFTYADSVDLAEVAIANANLRIIGVTGEVTSLVSVDSITGTSGDYTVTVTLSDASDFEEGDIAKFDEIGPLPHLSGDNSAPTILRGYPLPNELNMPVVACGLFNTTAGSAVVSFPNFVTSYGVLSDFIKPTDLIHCDGLTREVLSVDNTAKTVTFTDTWPRTLVSRRGYWLSRRNTGTCGTGGVLSDTVTFSNNIVAAEVNVGDILICEGGMTLVTEELGANSVRVSPAVNIAAGKSFSIWTTGVLHEGGHEVLSVSGNQITVKNRSKVKPAIKRVTTGRVKAIKTVFENTSGDGLLFAQGGRLAWMDKVAFVGSGLSSDTVGLLSAGREDTDVFGSFTQQSYDAAAMFGEDVVFTRWGRGAVVGNNCNLSNRCNAINGNVNLNVWVLEDGFINLRRAVTNGAGGTGLQINDGGVVLGTELRSWGCGADGVRLEQGANFYGEIPVFGANTVMNVRSVGNDNMHINEGVSIRAGASGIYISSGSADLSRMIIACNARENVELVDGADKIDTDEALITGARGTAGNGHGIYANGSEASAVNAALIGNKGDGLNAINGGRIEAAGARCASNQGVSARATKRGQIDVSGGLAPNITVATGGSVQADSVSISALVGVSRVNEFANDSSIVRDAASSTGFGVNGLIVAGGTRMAFYKRGTFTFDFPSIAAQQYTSTTVAVTGATTTGQVAAANSNSLDSALALEARVTSSDNLTIFARNPSAGALDPGNATLSSSIIG